MPTFAEKMKHEAAQANYAAKHSAEELFTETWKGVLDRIREAASKGQEFIDYEHTNRFLAEMLADKASSPEYGFGTRFSSETIDHGDCAVRHFYLRFSW